VNLVNEYAYDCTNTAVAAAVACNKKMHTSIVTAYKQATHLGVNTAARVARVVDDNSTRTAIYQC
jgi:hypothetical protein